MYNDSFMHPANAGLLFRVGPFAIWQEQCAEETVFIL
jgi:hypothetical protein